MFCHYANHCTKPQFIRYKTEQINKHPMGCVAQQNWKWLFTPSFLAADFDPWIRSDWPGFWHVTGFISTAVHAKLQVSVSSGYNSTVVNIQTDTQMSTHTDRQHCDQLIWKAQPAELKKTLTTVYSEEYETGSNFNWDKQLDPVNWRQETICCFAVVIVIKDQQWR